MRIILVFTLCVLSLAISAQVELSTENKRAIAHYESGRSRYLMRDYGRAAAELKKAVEYEPAFIEAYLMLAQTYADAKQLELSIDAYQHAIDIDPDFFPNALFFLAENERILGRYEDAELHYGEFVGTNPSNQKLLNAAQKGISSAGFAKEAVANPVDFKPVNLGPSINTAYDEYWPSLSADESMLVFTSLLPIDRVNPHLRSRKQEDLYFSRFEQGQWSQAKNVGPPLNTPENEGAQSISGDGRFMVFTGCSRADGQGLCDLYISENRNGIWTVPRNLGKTVNTRSSEKQPSLSSDGRILYFASDRPGGLGQYDIWVTHRMIDGSWTIPENLGDSINTSGMDQSPFIHPDNRSLYFSSGGWPGMGGYDIFLSRRTSDTTWSHPVNLGYPINTRHDEHGLIVNANANLAYFASDRLTDMGQDIFSFELHAGARPTRVSYMKGRVYDAKTSRPLGARFELIDLETKKLVIESNADPADGEFLVVIPVDADYALNVSEQGYLFHSENFSFDKVYARDQPYFRNIGLKPIEVGERIILKNVFFKTDSFALDQRSIVELGKIVGFMQSNPGLVVEIGGHTDNTGTAAYNMELSAKRAESTVSYLMDSGISADKISSKGYGMEEPVADNASEEGRSQNRRTELKIISK